MLTGIAPGDISRIECGWIKPWPGWKKRLAKALGVRMDDVFPQGEGGELFPNTAELFKKPTIVSQPQGEGGHWVFKTDKLTPLQVKACVCQQCPFPGELETKCDWCDNPKMMEFLRLAIPAMEDFFQQHEANALKEQMERVMGVIDRQINSYKDNNPLWINKVTVLEDIKDNLKSQLESE